MSDLTFILAVYGLGLWVLTYAFEWTLRAYRWWRS